jgi:hypothetical protein
VPRSAITIAPLAIAAFPVARLTFTTLAPPLTIAALTFTPLIVAPRAVAARTIAVTSIIPVLSTPTLITGTAATRATLAVLLLLRALARRGRNRLTAWCCRTFRLCATATSPAASRTIACRQSRQRELAARSYCFDTQTSRRLLNDGLVALGYSFNGRRFICRSGCRRRIRRGAFRLRTVTTAPATTTPAVRVAREMQRARRVTGLRRIGRFRRSAGFARANRSVYGRRRLGRGWRLRMWRRRGRWRARIFIVPDHHAET